MAMLRGVIKYWTIGGWGMINPDDKSPAVFIHHSELDKNEFPKDVYPKHGDRVEFDVRISCKNKPEAFNFRRVK